MGIIKVNNMKLLSLVLFTIVLVSVEAINPRKCMHSLEGGLNNQNIKFIEKRNRDAFSKSFKSD